MRRSRRRSAPRSAQAEAPGATARGWLARHRCRLRRRRRRARRLVEGDGTGQRRRGDRDAPAEAPHQRRIRALHRLGEGAEGLPRERLVRQPVEAVERAHRRPAGGEHGQATRDGRCEQAGQRLPVSHRLEGQILDRRAGDDHAVEVIGRNLRRWCAEGAPMRLGRSVRVLGRRREERQRHGLAPGAEKPRPSPLGRRLVGHKVDEADVQRAPAASPGFRARPPRGAEPAADVACPRHPGGCPVRPGEKAPAAALAVLVGLLSLLRGWRGSGRPLERRAAWTSGWARERREISCARSWGCRTLCVWARAGRGPRGGREPPGFDPAAGHAVHGFDGLRPRLDGAEESSARQPRRHVADQPRRLSKLGTLATTKTTWWPAWRSRRSIGPGRTA